MQYLNFLAAIPLLIVMTIGITMAAAPVDTIGSAAILDTIPDTLQAYAKPLASLMIIFAIMSTGTLIVRPWLR